MVHFTKKGSGHPLILLHGFPLNSNIWKDFLEHFETKYQLISIDLPGFGKSGSLNSPFTIDDVAKEILSALKMSGVQNCTLLGHSLGGYVALAMVDIQPDLFSSLILLHSTAYADNDEKKANRNKAIDFVSRHGVTAFTGNFIPPLFASPTHPSIDNVKKIAIEATADAVLSYTTAMRDRKDRTSVLRDFHRPTLLITGEKDTIIPVDSIYAQAGLSPSIQIEILPQVGHMSMYESPKKIAEVIHNFILHSNRR